jgi:hypothetical protein
MSDRSLSCAERIETQLTETEQGYARLWQRLDQVDATRDQDEREAVYEELDPLGIEVKPVVKVLLSWGGPSDWLGIELDSTRAHDVERITYHYADWFDHAEREVSEHEAPALWRAAVYYAEEMAYNLAERYGAD